MNIRVGQVIPIEADKRYIQHVRSHAIGDVYDALVELITNADVDCAPLTGEKN